MRKLIKIGLLGLIFLGLMFPFLLSQSRENGAIEGHVISDTDEFLSGVTVKLSSPNMIGGERTIVTGNKGQYRFPALLPGVYTIEVGLEGFTPQTRSDIRVSVSKTLTVDFQLLVESLEEEITVVAIPPMIDVKDSQQATYEVGKDFLGNIPTNRDFQGIINVSPGVVGRNAYGGGGDLGNAYNIDGINNNDPYFGGGWVMLDFNAIEDVKLMGVGAPAEYGGFTGGAVNVITRSGSNTLSGGAEFYFHGKNWHSNNAEGIDWAYGPEFSNELVIDPDFFLGGPVIKDKLWFFTNFQWRESYTEIVDFPHDIRNWSPRALLKFTWQPDSKNRLGIHLTYEANHADWDQAYPGWEEATASDYRSDDKLWNINWLHLFSDTTFLETKFAGWQAIERLIGKGGDAYPHIDWDTEVLSGNSWWGYDGDRYRVQLNSSLSHHAEDFIEGNHDFKFGVELERAAIQEDYGYTNGRAYWDYYGEPYYFIDWEGYPLDGAFQRSAAFVQDSWTISDRLTINPGLRVTMISGSLDGNKVYEPELMLAPRIGLTFDVFGDNSTAIKIHYGRYYEQMRITNLYPAMDIAPLNFHFWDWDAEEYVFEFSESLGHASVDPDIRHPAVDQFALSIERELIKDLSVDLTYIYKNHINMLGAVETEGQWEQVSYFDSNTGENYQLWQLMSDPYEVNNLITNPEAGTYDSVPFTPDSTYQSLQFQLTKRLSNNWGLQTSYVYSYHTGNFDIGTTRELIFNDFWKDKNETVNSKGHMLGDRTHVFKLHATTILPWDIILGTSFSYRSGYRYNNFVRVPGGVINTFGWSFSFRTEDRGKFQYPDYVRLDLRLEKQFSFDKFSISVLMDVFNLFNADTVTSQENTIQSSLYNKVYNIMDPRRFQVGIRFHF